MNCSCANAAKCDHISGACMCQPGPRNFCVQLTAGAPTARTSASVTTEVLATVCLAHVCVPRATPAPHVKTDAPTARLALGVSTAACVSTEALASTTVAHACVPPDMLAPSVKQPPYRDPSVKDLAHAIRTTTASKVAAVTPPQAPVNVPLAGEGTSVTSHAIKTEHLSLFLLFIPRHTVSITVHLCLPRTGFWGKGCQEACSCEHGSQCHHVTGECRCPPGFNGDKCQFVCPVGSYGERCDSTCQCEVGQPCDHVTGSCICPPGRQGHQCHEFCSDGHWGDECRETCQCEGSSLCDPVSGDCFCPAGLRGRKCRQSCLKGRYGVDCKQVSTGDRVRGEMPQRAIRSFYD
ncbi:Multiple epidermal growth factor-like domains protein 6 [Chionoecetes opilio]|uniref:Multiple epidermal growth factor-like domains protein 6 n=1 Tax=Chionoecetes opilio TaxID=41210 RepID=A0A8J5CRR0_CHIOP|nr:Multiple epidermal growth factor-like domains protein 6 [Chionoecetes opilio]